MQHPLTKIKASLCCLGGPVLWSQYRFASRAVRSQTGRSWLITSNMKFTHVSEELADRKVFSGRWGAVGNPVPWGLGRPEFSLYRLTLMPQAMLDLRFSQRWNFGATYASIWTVEKQSMQEVSSKVWFYWYMFFRNVGCLQATGCNIPQHRTLLILISQGCSRCRNHFLKVLFQSPLI